MEMSTEMRLGTTESMAEFETLPFVCVRFGAGEGEVGFQFETVESMSAFMTLFTMAPEVKLTSETGSEFTGAEMMGMLKLAERFTTTEFFARKSREKWGE